MRMKLAMIPIALVLTACTTFAQNRPGAFSSVTTTDATAASVCAGCPIGSTTPANDSGVTAASVILKNATPSNTTNKLYNVGGTPFFNGLALAFGSISGTTGTIPKFTASTTLGDGPIAVSGTVATMTGTLASTLKMNSNTTGTVVSGIADGLNIGTWDTIGFDSAKLDIGGYRSSQWTSMAFWLSGAQVARYDTSGNYVLGSGTNITDSTGTPSINAGCGTSPTIVGKDYAFVITIGTGGTDFSCSVLFGRTFANVPACVSDWSLAAGTSRQITVSTTSVLLVANPILPVGGHIYVICRGF